MPRPMAHVHYVPNSCLVSIYSRPMADLFLLRLTVSARVRMPKCDRNYDGYPNIIGHGVPTVC
jgi:hypothetical protein